MPNVFYMGHTNQPSNRSFIFNHMPENINGQELQDLFTNKIIFMAVLDETEEIGDVLVWLDKLFPRYFAPEQLVPGHDETNQNGGTPDNELRMIFAFPDHPITVMNEYEEFSAVRCFLEQLGIEYPANWMSSFPALLFANRYPGPVPCQTALHIYQVVFSARPMFIPIRSVDEPVRPSGIAPIGIDQFSCSYLPFMVRVNIGGKMKPRVKWICIVHEDPTQIKITTCKYKNYNDRDDPPPDCTVPIVTIIDDEEESESKCQDPSGKQALKHFGTTRFLSRVKKSHITFKLAETIKQTTRSRLRSKLKWRNLCERVANQPRIVIV